MEVPYITSFQAVLDECERITKSKIEINGNCRTCFFRRACKQDKKERCIDSILHMEAKDTRFPHALSIVLRKPGLLHMTPSTVYEKLYGSYRDALPCPFQADLITRHLEDLKAVYELLEDTESRQTLLNTILYRLTLNRDYILRAYSAEPQYFIPSFRTLRSDEVYVDCGAYIGDTFADYCTYNEAPRSAYLFEPDSENLHVMETVLKDYRRKTDLHIIEKGVYNCETTLYFLSGKKTDSMLLEKQVKGSVPLAVTSIDRSIDEDITFLKMDIEGSEKDALLGAKCHIENSYPRLAICMYHKPSDFWGLPLLIHELFPKYSRFELRHHSRFFAETVLYVSR